MKSYFSIKPGAFLWYNEASVPNLCPDMAERASRQYICYVSQCRSNHGLRNGYRERRLSQSRSNLPSFPSVGRDSFTQVPRCQQRFIFRTQFPLSLETLERPSGSSLGTGNIIML